MTTDRHDETFETQPVDERPTRPTAATPTELGARFYHVFGGTNPHRDGDLLYFDGLISDFGNQIDLVDEMMRFQAWTLDKGEPIRYPRSKFRDWLLRSRNYRRQRSTSQDQSKRQ